VLSSRSPAASPLLVDLDGVVREWEPAFVATTESRHRLPAGSLYRAAYIDDGMLPALLGSISHEEWQQRVHERLSRFGAGAGAAVLEWSAAIGVRRADVLAVLAHERHRRPVVLLTNATSRLYQDLENLGLAESFDAVLTSFELGMTKPDPRLFEHACAVLGRTPSECLFVDDSASTVRAAARLGLRTHLFRGTRGLVDFLEREG